MSDKELQEQAIRWMASTGANFEVIEFFMGDLSEQGWDDEEIQGIIEDESDNDENDQAEPRRDN